MKCRYISLGGWLVHPSYMWNNVTIFVKNNLWLSVIYFLILLFYYSTLTLLLVRIKYEQLRTVEFENERYFHRTRRWNIFGDYLYWGQSIYLSPFLLYSLILTVTRMKKGSLIFFWCQSKKTESQTIIIITNNH